jgi:predicted MPP superfamily phosphohydrolase
MIQFWIFIIILSIVTGCGYYYLGIKFLHRVDVSHSYMVLGWLTITSLWLLTPSAYIISLLDLIREKSKTFSLLAFINLGFFTILLFFSVASDLFLYIYNKFYASNLAETPIPIGESRKDFLLKFINPSILGFSSLLTAYGYVEATQDWTVENVKIKISKLTEDLKTIKIIQISDIHVGPTIKRDTIERLVKRVNDLKPDIIAITGDLVDGSVLQLRDDVAPLKELKSTLGTFFVTGNHEYYSGAISWIKELNSLGIKTLLNESLVLKINNSKILLSGVTDYKAGRIIPDHETNPEACLLNQPDCDIKILLAHQPKSIFRASKLGFDLQLSGHTHGGQYFPGNILIYLFQEYVAGLYKHENTWLYVNRGTGYWGPPIRTANRPEISSITFEEG